MVPHFAAAPHGFRRMNVANVAVATVETEYTRSYQGGVWLENQRKSRTLHSDGAARMGLRKGGNIGGYASDNTLLKTNARLITLEFLEKEY
jgi:hypothetical protein